LSRNCNGPNGVLIANHTQVWVGGGNNTVWKLQLNNGHILAKISTALPGTTDRTRADELPPPGRSLPHPSSCDLDGREVEPEHEAEVQL
jgi:hypothetical protein